MTQIDLESALKDAEFLDDTQREQIVGALTRLSLFTAEDIQGRLTSLIQKQEFYGSSLHQVIDHLVTWKSPKKTRKPIKESLDIAAQEENNANSTE